MVSLDLTQPRARSVRGGAPLSPAEEEEEEEEEERGRERGREGERKRGRAGEREGGSFARLSMSTTQLGGAFLLV